MADQKVTITIPDAFVPEVRAAVNWATGAGGLASPTEFRAFVRAHIKQTVLQYRDTLRPVIDLTDPTAD